MYLSAFELFKIGIGPSSSHTVGPMVAARRFLKALDAADRLSTTSSIGVTIYGSLALTGIGHGTDKALILGLEGHDPATIDPDIIEERLNAVRQTGKIALLGRHPIQFDEKTTFQYRMEEQLPYHSNGLEFFAYDQDGELLAREVYYSVGGGFVQSEQDIGSNQPAEPEVKVPYPFDNAAELLDLCRQHNLTIAELMFANEKVLAPERMVRDQLNDIHQAMENCIDRGCSQTGTLPGGLNVTRRAHALCKSLRESQEKQLADPTIILDWINLWALAVNEENAAGGRVVTAPTNGAAGIIPAVLRYYDRFYNRHGEDGIHTFLLTAAAIGSLYKKNASISGAEVGCQGEVGVACSMAAGGLAAAMGGSNEQVENAAEIGMEHNLGLTCDPIGGLVQVPCIERNAMGAVKAIDAARLALRGDGKHMVSLDKVIETMNQTGRDMQDKYKETSKGGLAVSVPLC